MSKIMHKNQVIITALAIMIAIAGYLNFTDDSQMSNKMGEVYEASALKGDSKINEKSTQNDSKKVNEKATETEDKQTTESTNKTSNTNTSENEEVVSKNAVAADEEYEASSEVETIASNENNDETENVGDAVLVNSTISMNYFYTVKLSREQTRAKNKEELMNIVESATVTEQQKQNAINEIIELTDITEKENEAEMLLSARGFENSVVTIGDNGVDVVIDSETVTEEQIAQVCDIVSRKTGISLEKIVITPVNAQEKK